LEVLELEWEREQGVVALEWERERELEQGVGLVPELACWIECQKA
jgi:hypothetical protein